VSTPHFPSEDSLCEKCGYPLKGLSPDGGCPECGQPIAESSPALRTGPGKLPGALPGALLKTVIELTLRPKRFFRAMRVDGSNLWARLLMLNVVLLIGLSWWVWDVLAWSNWQVALVKAFIVMGGLYLLSYTEAVGVVFFSRKRDWRVPFKLAERLVCYGSIGWIPAALVVGWAVARFQDGSLDRWMRHLLGTWGLWQSVELLMLVSAVALLWFEVLVWIGVRQTKYANSSAECPDLPTEGEPSGAC